MKKILLSISVLIVLITAVYWINSLSHKATPVVQDSNVSAEGWKTYTNKEYSFTFQFPNEYVLNNTVSQEVTVSTKENYIDNSSFSVKIDKNKMNINSCLKVQNGDKIENIDKTKKINSNTYYVINDKQDDAAMGGARGKESDYVIVHNNMCYLISFDISWHQVGYPGQINTGKNSATELERQTQMQIINKHDQILDKIISRLKFIK